MILLPAGTCTPSHSRVNSTRSMRMYLPCQTLNCTAANRAEPYVCRRLPGLKCLQNIAEVFCDAYLCNLFSSHSSGTRSFARFGGPRRRCEENLPSARRQGEGFLLNDGTIRFDVYRRGAERRRDCAVCVVGWRAGECAHGDASRIQRGRVSEDPQGDPLAGFRGGEML